MARHPPGSAARARVERHLLIEDTIKQMNKEVARRRSSDNGGGPPTKRGRFNDRRQRKWFNFEIKNQNLICFD